MVWDFRADAQRGKLINLRTYVLAVRAVVRIAAYKPLRKTRFSDGIIL
jgi:hypothetical protein